MSMEMHAVIRGSELPSRVNWQAAIDALGYPLQLSPDLDPASSSGFVPCVLNGVESGFELFRDNPAEFGENCPDLLEETRDARWVVSFRWGGELLECACASAAAAGLIKCANARVYSAEDGLWYDTEALRSCFDSCVAG